MATILMIAPTPVSSAIVTSSGNTYVPDAQGYFTAQMVDILDLQKAGFLVAPAARANFTATTDPGITNDSSQDYAAGSRWLNSTTGRWFECILATVGAAVWVPIAVNLIGKLIGANFNITTDQAFTMFVPAAAKFRVTKITALNTSVAGMSTAAGGIYPATAKGGTALVAAGQAYTGLTNAATALDLTLATAAAVQAAAVKLYLSLTTGQGAAATADLYAYGDVYH